jgi:hypothetical protein
MHQDVVSCWAQQYKQTFATSANTAKDVDQAGDNKQIWTAFAHESGRALRLSNQVLFDKMNCTACFLLIWFCFQTQEWDDAYAALNAPTSALHI